MKLKKLLSAIISIVMIASCIVVPVSANQAIYTEANGWTLPTNSEGAIAAELSDGRLELNNEALFTPKLEENKKYSIKFNVTGLEKGDDWTYQFRLALISGGETLDGALSYRQAGIWENGKEQKWLANGTDGEVEVIFDTGSGVYKMYALGAFSASGIFADASDFTLKFYKWGGNAPYISNVRVEELAQNSIYNSANGWALPASSEDVSATETADGKLQMNHEVRFTPELKENKKYSIKFNVTGIEKGDDWTYQFRLALMSGGETLDGALSYRQAGIWENSKESKWLANGTDGEIEVIIDTGSGVYKMYALGAFSASGIFADASDFTLKFYKWGGNAPYISNVRIEELSQNSIYNAANGWTLPTNSEDVSATEIADGKLQLDNQAIFKPTLEAGKKYSIKYDVTGLEKGDAWTFQFRVKMSAGGKETDSVFAYRMEGVWEARNLAVAHGNGTNEIIIDTNANTWEAYALGSLSQYGTVESFDDFALTFYKWGGPAACISNVTVTDITSTDKYYEQNFDQIAAEFSNWRAATASEVRATQPLQVWGGSFETTNGNKSVLSGAMDIYPLAVTEKNGKYSVKFDIKPNAATDANGSNWEGIVMQWNLGSSNSDAWHDMKLGTSQGANVEGEVAIDRLWIFGQEMAIDPSQWINVNIIYDCTTESIEAKVTQGSNVVEGVAKFNCNTESLTGTPKITFDGLERNGVKYPGVYIDNIEIKKVKENLIYNSANGWTLPLNDNMICATETEDGKLKLDNEAKFTPTLEKGKKYSIKFDVTGLEKGDAWTYQFRLALIAGGTTLDGALSYRQEGVWENGNEQKFVAGGTDGEVEVIIDTATGEYKMYALGSLSKIGTFANADDFTLKFYKWGGNAPYISNVRVEELSQNSIYNFANGWTLPTNSEDVCATETEDGKLQLNNQAIFKPTLEAGKKYSIKYDVTGLETGDAWTFQFRAKMSAGGTETDGILAYRMEGVWEARNLAVAHGNGTNEIIIDTNANTWEAYALGSLSQYGTVESFDNLALTFYKWGGPAAYISNVTVEDITSEVTYYEQNFDQVEAEFSNWRAATVNEVRETQPLQVWGGSFATTGKDKHLISSAMDIYPLAVTPKTDNYEVSFDIKPNATTDANGSNWEGIVMQWNLGSSNADSWHDMKLGTSQGANAEGEVAIDRLWIFGQEMVIDPSQWINVKLVYICSRGTIEARITQGTTEVTASAPFTVNASSLTGSPKVTFEGIERNGVKYDGVYLDNIIINEIEIIDERPIISNCKIISNGEEVDSLIGLSTFDIELNFMPEKQKSNSVIAMVGVYDNEENFVESGFESKIVDETNNSITINVILDTPYASDNSCKVFVWDGELRPLFPVIYPTEE